MSVWIPVNSLVWAYVMHLASCGIAYHYFALSAGRGVKYCDEYDCLSVCPLT